MPHPTCWRKDQTTWGIMRILVVGRLAIAAYVATACSGAESIAPKSPTLTLGRTSGAQSLDAPDHVFQGRVIQVPGVEGDIGVDSVTGELRLRDYATGRVMFVDLPATAMSKVAEAIHGFEVGDANMAALDLATPLLYKPGYNEMRAQLRATGADGAATLSRMSSEFLPSGMLSQYVGESTAPLGEVIPSANSSYSGAMPSVGATVGLLPIGSWNARCDDAANLIMQIKANYVAGKREYLTGILGLVPFGDFVGGTLLADGSIEVKPQNPGVVALIVAAVSTLESYHMSRVYDWTRVMYNSWQCQIALNVGLPEISVFKYSFSKPSGNGTRKVCVVQYKNWLVSTDGGATWTMKSYKSEHCWETDME